MGLGSETLICFGRGIMWTVERHVRPLNASEREHEHQQMRWTKWK